MGGQAARKAARDRLTLDEPFSSRALLRQGQKAPACQRFRSGLSFPMLFRHEDAFIIISVTIPVNCQKLIDCPIFFKVVNHLLASC